jgi:arylsulfatase A-like enzyme
MNLARLRDMLPDVPEDVRRGIEALYDGEVRHTDRCVGELLELLASAGELEHSWIVVLADHGEEFFEHGGYEHGHSLMPEVTGVPLLIRPPGGLAVGVRDDRAVTLLDLLPSLGAALGWPLPDALPGRPALTPDASGSFPDPAPLTVLENMLYGPPEQATLSWPDLRVMEPESGLDAWFDLARDPTARSARPAPADADRIAAARRDLIARWNDRRAELVDAGDAGNELSEAAQRRLRSLGY